MFKMSANIESIWKTRKGTSVFPFSEPCAYFLQNTFSFFHFATPLPALPRPQKKGKKKRKELQYVILQRNDLWFKSEPVFTSTTEFNTFSFLTEK